MGSPGGGVDSGGGPGGSGGPGGGDNGGRGSDEDSRTSSKSESGQAGMTGSERTQEAEAKNENSFSESLAEAKAEADRNRSPNDDGGNSTSNTNGNNPSPSETPDTVETDEEDRGGLLDRAGDFFGGLAQGMQNFARENPRVDSHGNTVGLVDSDGIQRGEVASRVRSSGTSSDDLAAQLGFSSPQDMAAAQNTDFIGEKYQEDLAQRAMVEAIEGRYGKHPDLGALNADANRTALAKSGIMLAGYDDVAKTGVRNATRVLGPVGFLMNLAIDIFEPTPVADGTLKNEEAPEEVADQPTRPTDKPGKIASETGLTEKEVREKIHEAKRNLPRGGDVKNPDVAVDLDTGEIHPKNEDGTYGDSIGNIDD